MNSLRHGLRARTVVLPAENAGEFHQLCSDLEAEWQPQSRTEQFYVEQVAVSQWKLTRVEVAEKSILTQEARATFQIPLIDKLWQFQHRLERLQNSRRDQVHRPEEPVPASQQEARPASAAASAVAPQPQPAPKAPHVMPSPAAAAAAPSAAPSPRVEPRRPTAAS